MENGSVGSINLLMVWLVMQVAREKEESVDATEWRAVPSTELVQIRK